MLGVRWVGVTHAASALQKRRLISYDRSRVIILDRADLENAARVCYSAAMKTYDRIMGYGGLLQSCA
jgi:hypothetical protein